MSRQPATAAGERSRDQTQAIVAGILVSDGLALVARRPPGAHLEGTWEFPGGKVEPGETGEEALRREFQEEIGVGFDAARELYRLEHRYADRTVVLTFFLCTGMRGEPAGREHQELRWVDGAELRKLPTPEANRTVIERLGSVLSRKQARRPGNRANEN